MLFRSTFFHSQRLPTPHIVYHQALSRNSPLSISNGTHDQRAARAFAGINFALHDQHPRTFATSFANSYPRLRHFLPTGNSTRTCSSLVSLHLLPSLFAKLCASDRVHSVPCEWRNTVSPRMLACYKSFRATYSVYRRHDGGLR